MIGALDVDISKLYTVIFALDAALAGLSGALVDAIQWLEVAVGLNLSEKSFDEWWIELSSWRVSEASGTHR